MVAEHRHPALVGSAALRTSTRKMARHPSPPATPTRRWPQQSTCCGPATTRCWPTSPPPVSPHNASPSHPALEQPPVSVTASWLCRGLPQRCRTPGPSTPPATSILTTASACSTPARPRRQERPHPRDRRRRLTALDTDPLVRPRHHRQPGPPRPRRRRKTSDCRNLDAWWDGCPFDRILADVPCFGLQASMRRNPTSWLRRSDDIHGSPPSRRRSSKPVADPRAGWQNALRDLPVFAEENGDQIAAFAARHPIAAASPSRGNSTASTCLAPNMTDSSTPCSRKPP